jgi:hypothetical protein
VNRGNGTAKLMRNTDFNRQERQERQERRERKIEDIKYFYHK